MVRIERKSSLEDEPRTLNINQLQFARDAALYVVKTRSIEEATRIFTQGLAPVASVAEQNRRTTMDSFIEEVFDDYLVNELQMPCPKDIASAPF